MFDRMTAQLSCPMDLRNYPLDVQMCPLLIEPCEYVDLFTIHHFTIHQTIRKNATFLLIFCIINRIKKYITVMSLIYYLVYLGFFSDSHVISDMVLSLLDTGITIDSSIELAQFIIGRIDVENTTKTYATGNMFTTTNVMNTYIQRYIQCWLIFVCVGYTHRSISDLYLCALCIPMNQLLAYIARLYP